LPDGDMGLPAARGQAYGIFRHRRPGAGTGEGLGFPNANLVPPRELLLLTSRVYGAVVDLGEAIPRSLLSAWGSRPTFDDDPYGWRPKS
jgi:FAD synthase